MFFAIEGIDGCGKSTVIEGLKRILGEGKFVFLSDPGSTGFGKALRGILKDGSISMCNNAQLLAFTAARSQLVDEFIRPVMESGRHVVCDRYVLSTYAYQNVFPRMLLNLNDEFCYGVLPGLNVVINCDVDVAVSRTMIRSSKDRFDGNREFMTEVNERYHSNMCQMFGKTVYVNGMKERQEVANDVVGAMYNACGGMF